MRKLYVYPSGNTFEKIKAWKLGRIFKNILFEETKRFPDSERFSLTSQILRAAISITANIAEGYGRFYYKETIQFARQARGSVSEIIDHLYTSLDFKYITQEAFDNYYKEARELEMAINGYIKFLKTQMKNSK